MSSLSGCKLIDFSIITKGQSNLPGLPLALISVENLFGTRNQDFVFPTLQNYFFCFVKIDRITLHPIKESA